MNTQSNAPNVEPLFPDVIVNLNSPAGNAFTIMAIVQTVLERAGYEREEMDSILKDMKSSDYEHLCTVAGKFITLFKSNQYKMEK